MRAPPPACAHDVHTAVQLRVAAVLAWIKAELPGTVKFILQPAEEGPPQREEAGASLRAKEGRGVVPEARRDFRTPHILRNGCWGRGWFMRQFRLASARPSLASLTWQAYASPADDHLSSYRSLLNVARSRP